MHATQMLITHLTNQQVSHSGVLFIGNLKWKTGEGGPCIGSITRAAAVSDMTVCMCTIHVMFAGPPDRSGPGGVYMSPNLRALGTAGWKQSTVDVCHFLQSTAAQDSGESVLQKFSFCAGKAKPSVGTEGAAVNM